MSVYKNERVNNMSSYTFKATHNNVLGLRAKSRGEGGMFGSSVIINSPIFLTYI